MGLRFKPERMAAVAALTLLLASCGGGGGSSSASSSGSFQPSNTPQIVSLTPSSVAPGSNDFTLTVNGSNFRSDSIVLWNDAQKPSTFISSSQVTAIIPKADVANGVNVAVKVNSASAGQTAPMVLKVEFPKPTITSLSKTSAQVNDPGFTLTVNGSNFFNGAHVQWDGIDRVTQFVSGTQLTAQILAGDLAVGGNHTIRVSNPSPNAGISDAANFFVQAPKPAITSISPDTVYAGSAGYYQFTITGTNFLPTSKVSWDGAVYTGNLTANSIQITLAQPIPHRLGLVEVKVSNDGFGPQTDSTSITLIPSAAGINSSPALSYLFTDDLRENVYAEHTVDTADFGYRVSIFDTCIGVASCTPTNHPIVDLGTPKSWPAYLPTSISADARYISYLPEVAPVSGHFLDLGPQYVFDTCKGAVAGCAPASYRITVPIDGSAPNDDSGGPGGCSTTGCFPIGQLVSISADGRYVSFQSNLTNLTAGDTTDVLRVYFRDMCLGAPAGCVPTTIRVGESNRNDITMSPRMSRDGRFVFYQGSSASPGVHAYDTCVGAPAGCVRGDSIVSIDDTGATFGGGPYAISSNGRYVAFGGGFPTLKTWIRDTCFGVTTACTPTTVVLITTSDPQSVSPDGKYVAVITSEDFGDPADTTPEDLYVIKTCLGASGCTPVAKRISVDAQGIQTGASRPAAFTTDGQRLIYYQSFVGTVITESLTLP